MGLGVSGARARLSGPVTRRRSSPVAARAWCDACGVSVLLQDHGSDMVELCPGLFENAGGAGLMRVV
ncbi:hypothetical protein [Ponticoccus litoralis]|uniref:CENP-V/GFA domain-containing protein n=1 Tax=Ponticoccus litoralis TaxID=422297 RepID=A0AAW9SGK4_9RHOB